MTTTTTAPVTPKQEYASKDHYLLLLDTAQVPYVVQTGFIKVEPVKGRRLYVANAKGGVKRIDLSGFEIPLDQGVTKVPDQGVFGNVRQQMKIEGTVDEQLERFAWILAHAQSLDPRASPPKASSPASKPAPTPVRLPASLLPSTPAPTPAPEEELVADEA